MSNIQYLSDTNGKIKSVLVPFKLWEEIISESETKFLLKSKKMKSRIDESKKKKILRNKKRKLMRNLVFELNALEDIEYWVKNNNRIAQKVIKIIKEIERNPFGRLQQA